MQIFDDSKKRIALLTGYKEREITKTLSSGDKEMVFQYPANGKDTEALKEEYYIRTKTDEYVIKAVEKGETYNKYTAVLNVEELEGEAFAYGFASQEQTIRACLEFAFEDTGWTVGTCEITKKRTINIEESTTAWKVLQSCLKTYRCECNIDTLNKRVNIYEHIGRDRGCYFVEGMNLRKLTINSDTYDFYTRILPLGKDGISIEFLHGKEYLENYQYSTKVKTYVWKDERYTNTTSLMEDAEAKLEEMSKPYKVFAADVIDLAKQNPDYKDILDYGIGDTVRMVSKKTHTREKQRIVKITEYPENPKKNKVELSNTTKTFAEVQKTEAELSKNETIDIANKSTQKVLEDKYWTKKEVESHITASKEEVSLGVSKIYETKDAVEEKIKLSDGRTDEKLTKYYTKEETKSALDMTAESINLEVSKTYATQTTVTEKYNSAVKAGQTAADTAETNAKNAMYEKLTEYSTTEEMNSAIDLKMDAITLSVSKTYATNTSVTEKYNSAITAGQNAANAAEKNATAAGQTAADAAEKNAKDALYEKLTEYSTTEQMNSAIDLKLDEISLSVSKTYATQSSVTEKYNKAKTYAMNVADAAEENAIADTVEKLKSYSTTEEMNSAIDLKLDEINLSVSKTYATQTTVTEKYNSAVKKGQTAADAAEKNAIADTTQRLKSYSTTEEMNAAIKLKADGITTEVNKKVSNSEFGTKITQNAYNVRVAWNNNSNYIQLESGKLVIYNGETTTNQKRAAFDQNGNHFYRDGYYVGKIGTNYWSDNDAHKGLVFDLDYQGKYMAFAQKPSSSSNAYSTMLCFSRANSIYNTYGVHMGCDLDMHNYKLKNVSWEKGGITGTLNFVKVVSMDSDGTVNTWTNGCKLQFENGILIAGTW
jgi:phage minor structural protein